VTTPNSVKSSVSQDFEVFQAMHRSVHRTVLGNGIRLLVTENPSADIISARMLMQGGQRAEAAGKAGVAHLVSSVMTKGTATRSSFEIAEQVEAIGASLGTDSSADHFQVTVKTVSADFGGIFELAGEILRSPSFPTEEVELERKLTLQGIRSQQEQPFSVAMDKMRHALYGDHPYADSGLGTLETVAQLTIEDLNHYHQSVFRPDNLIISIAGRITVEEAYKEVTRVFGDWVRPEQPMQPLELPTIAHNPQTHLTPQDSAQSIVIVGYLAPSINPALPNATSDYAALKLLNTYLSGGLSSRLFIELREKRGLAYEVSAYYPMRLDVSFFVAYIGTAPDNTATALEGLREELHRLTEVTLTEEELQTSKDKFLGQYALSKQTNAQLAQTFAWYEMLGLGLGYDDRLQTDIRNLTAATLRTTAKRIFGQPYLSILGPEGVLQPLSAEVLSPQL
jgi:zinc protease